MADIWKALRIRGIDAAKAWGADWRTNPAFAFGAQQALPQGGFVEENVASMVSRIPLPSSCVLSVCLLFSPPR